ncbi:MAG: hypothetical protein MUF22_03315 [Chitinispirillaceae bacterium]|jgi:hypothetical protein|nr:hypothetical protein [Chitinispirillaceae bacterium]
MNAAISDYKAVRQWAGSMDGVFSRMDLENLFNLTNPVLFYRRLRVLIDSGVLCRFRREFYITEDCNLEALARRMYPDSYISMGSVLARRCLIGSIPARTVYAVKTGRNRTFSSPRGTIVYCGISPDLVFDCVVEDGVLRASPEKAWLDALYFYQKGFRFSFDVTGDVNLPLLDHVKIIGMLKKYQNPRFVSFVRGVLSGAEQ